MRDNMISLSETTINSIEKKQIEDHVTRLLLHKYRPVMYVCYAKPCSVNSYIVHQGTNKVKVAYISIADIMLSLQIHRQSIGRVACGQRLLRIMMTIKGLRGIKIGERE